MDKHLTGQEKLIPRAATFPFYVFRYYSLRRMKKLTPLLAFLLATSFLVIAQASSVYYGTPRYYGRYSGSYYGFTYNSPSTYLNFGYTTPYYYQQYNYPTHAYYYKPYHQVNVASRPCYNVNGYMHC